MRSNILNKLLQRGRKGNPLSRIDALEQKNNAAFLRNPAAERLTDITRDLGTIVSGEFIAPSAEATSTEPTDVGFTGAAMGGNGWTFNSVVWHFVAVAAGVLQAGFNYLGQFIAGGGAVTLDALGVQILNGITTANFLNWINSIGDTVGYVRTASDTLTESSLVVKSIAATAGGAIDSSISLITEARDGSGPSVSLTANDSDHVSDYVYSQAFLNALAIRGTGTTINDLGTDADTLIKGDTTTVVTVDAALEAMGVGGAADAGGVYKLKVTGATNITEGVVLDKGLVVNESGAALNFRVESDGDVNNIFSDGTNNRVGIGTSTPATKLEVNGQTTTAGITSSGFFNLGAAGALTITSDAVTATKSYHTVDTEGGAATDNLATINGGTAGDILILRTANNARDVTVKDGTGNIALASDFLMDTIQDTITLLYNGTTWLEICRSNNA